MLLGSSLLVLGVLALLFMLNVGMLTAALVILVGVFLTSPKKKSN